MLKVQDYVIYLTIILAYIGKFAYLCENFSQWSKQLDKTTSMK